MTSEWKKCTRCGTTQPAGHVEHVVDWIDFQGRKHPDQRCVDWDWCNRRQDERYGDRQKKAAAGLEGA